MITSKDIVITSEEMPQMDEVEDQVIDIESKFFSLLDNGDRLKLLQSVAGKKMTMKQALQIAKDKIESSTEKRHNDNRGASDKSPIPAKHKIIDSGQNEIEDLPEGDMATDFSMGMRFPSFGYDDEDEFDVQSIPHHSPRDNQHKGEAFLE
eukprot:gene7407-9765_t